MPIRELIMLNTFFCIISRVRTNCQPHKFYFNVWNILIPRSSDFVSLYDLFWTRKIIPHKLCTNKWRPVWELCVKPGKPHSQAWRLSVFKQRPRNCSPFLSHIRPTFSCLVSVGICLLEGTQIMDLSFGRLYFSLL